MLCSVVFCCVLCCVVFCYIVFCVVLHVVLLCCVFVLCSVVLCCVLRSVVLYVVLFFLLCTVVLYFLTSYQSCVAVNCVSSCRVLSGLFLYYGIRFLLEWISSCVIAKPVLSCLLLIFVMIESNNGRKKLCGFLTSATSVCVATGDSL